LETYKNRKKLQTKIFRLSRPATTTTTHTTIYTKMGFIVSLAAVYLSIYVRMYVCMYVSIYPCLPLLQVLHALLQVLHALLQRLRKAGGALQRFSEMCYGVQVCYERLY
jgi:hypothetical protein